MKREYTEYKATREHVVGNGNAHPNNNEHEVERVEADHNPDITHRTKPHAEVSRATFDVARQ